LFRTEIVMAGRSMSARYRTRDRRPLTGVTVKDNIADAESEWPSKALNVKLSPPLPALGTSGPPPPPARLPGGGVTTLNVRARSRRPNR
jgi:hypothetical protein